MTERSVQRKLKRKDTPDEDDCAIVVRKTLCVIGGHLEKWCPLETKVVDGQECVCVTSTSCAWLNIILCGYAISTKSTSLALKTVFDDLRGRQVEAASSASSAGPSESMSEAAAQVLNAASSSDDDDEDSQKGKKCNKEVWTTVECAIGDISFKPCRSQRLLIHVDSLPVFLRTCIDAYRRSKRHVLKIPSTDMDEIIPKDLLTEEDKGRISFDLRNPSWIIHYKNTPRQRKPNTSKDGLAIPQAKLDGSSWTHAEYRDALCTVLTKARRMWNALDASGAPKYAGIHAC